MLYRDELTQTGCKAALNILGEHFDCDWPTDENGKHPGWSHSSKAAQTLWCDDRDGVED